MEALPEERLIEAVVVGYHPGTQVANAAVVGVRRFNNLVLMRVFSDTDTAAILLRNRAVTINLTDDPFVLAAAALRGWSKGLEEPELPPEFFCPAKAVAAPCLRKACAVVEARVLWTDAHTYRDRWGTTSVIHAWLEMLSSRVSSVVGVQRGLGFFVEALYALSKAKVARYHQQHEEASRLVGRARGLIRRALQLDARISLALPIVFEFLEELL